MARRMPFNREPMPFAPEARAKKPQRPQRQSIFNRDEMPLVPEAPSGADFSALAQKNWQEGLPAECRQASPDEDNDEVISLGAVPAKKPLPQGAVPSLADFLSQNDLQDDPLDPEVMSDPDPSDEEDETAASGAPLPTYAELMADTGTGQEVAAPSARAAASQAEAPPAAVPAPASAPAPPSAAPAPARAPAPPAAAPAPGKRVAEREVDKSVVSIITVLVLGAGTSQCNGVYSFEGTHKGKPLFKAPTGAIIFFQDYWKLNSSYKTTSCLYSVQDAKGTLPPTGQWARDSKGGGAQPAPTLRISGTPLRVLGEKGPTIKLEGGKTVSKREEHKSWHWGWPGDDDGEDELEEPEDLAEEEEAAEEVAEEAPPASRRSIAGMMEPPNARQARSSQGASGAPSIDEILAAIDRDAEEDDHVAVPSMEEMLESLDHDAEEESLMTDSQLSREVFREIGVASSAAVRDYETSKGATVGRGHDFSFSAIRAMGQEMIQASQPESSSSIEARQRNMPPPQPVSKLASRLRALESRGTGLLCLKDDRK
mmetsp:Transcript_130691/g.279467  ORF Transcript_130691/g.279467 Transcript_130691/m.279467 type:complete len:541 (-) Transcript_130691:212-1834(-)